MPLQVLEKYGGPLIIIDFGTATTYDVVSKEGDYLGGVDHSGIGVHGCRAPSPRCQTPRIELRFPPSTIGYDTASSMQAGVLFGTVDAVEGIVKRIRTELGAPARVIATGGLANIIAAHTAVIEAIEPSLVLDGIRLIMERLEKKRRETRARRRQGVSPTPPTHRLFAARLTAFRKSSLTPAQDPRVA